MARRTFFSFHYGNDVWRANIVRHSWVIAGSEEAGFVDSVDFEKIEREGEEAVKRWIRNQLIGTSVTVVLIGSETSSRRYIQYELQKSYEKGNGMLGIYIHNIKDRFGNTSTQGNTDFGEIGKDANGRSVYFSKNYRCYDWVIDDGYNNIGNWIEAAARQAGK